MLGIGSTVWVFDGNHRVYRDGQSGPIYREHWQPQTITSVGRRYWHTNKRVAIDRTTLRTRMVRGFGNKRVLTSLAAVNDDVFLQDNRYRISELVRRCNNADALRTIERIAQAAQ